MRAARPAALAATVLGSMTAGHAATLSAGAPITTVPAALVDPFGSLATGLGATRFLVPIEAAAAEDLQDWTFDLLFDATRFAPVDAGGICGSVYAALFNADDPVASQITSTGLLLDGVLQGIAGFASGVSGDGVLAYVLFERVAGQPVPVPGSLALAVLALWLLGATARGTARSSQPRSER
jgi:hypothetical protein